MSLAPIYILLGAGLTVLTAFALGRMLLEAIGWRPAREECAGLAFLAGAPCLSLLVFAVGMAGAARKGVFLALGAAVLLWAWRKRMLGLPERQPPGLPRRARLALALVFAAFTFYYLVNAMAPEHSPDGTQYRLALVASYSRAHAIHFTPYNMYGLLSQGAEMLYLFAFSIGRHSAASMVHCAFLLALAQLIVACGRRIGSEPAGWGAALLVYASPVAGVCGTSAYNDVAVAAVVFALFYMLEFGPHSRSGVLFAAGLMAGFAYGVKYTAFAAIPYAALVAARQRFGQRRRRWKAMALLAAGIAVSVLPWVVRNTIWTGNPFAPFLNRYFPNPYVLAEDEEYWRELMRRPPGMQSYRQLPLELTLKAEFRPGILGPVFLLAPVALLALRSSFGRKLLLAFAVFGATLFANIEARFLLPALPFLALAMCLALEASKALLACVVLAHCLFAWPPLLARLADPGWSLTELPLRAALRLETEDDYLAARVAGYREARLIDRETPEGLRVYSQERVAAAYTAREVVVSHHSAAGRRLTQALWDAIGQPPESDARRKAMCAMRAAGIGFLLVQESDYAASDLHHNAARWGIGEAGSVDGSRLYRIGPHPCR